MPRWTLPVAFLAGLLPGLLLYWNAPRPSPAPLPAPVKQGSPAPAATPSPAPEAKTSEVPKGGKERPRDAASRDADTRLIAENQELQAKFNAIEHTLAEAQAKLRETEARLTAAQEQQEKSAQAAAAELKEQLQATQRQMAQAEAAAKLREARLHELEGTQQRLQRQSTEAQQRLQRTGELAGELDEIARRRESYLNAIIARYREATDLFRAISLRLDNPRDASSPLNNDLARIQTAIQGADEDLRQIRALNAQSAKLQKELSARR